MAKTPTKAHGQEHHSSPLHVSNRIVLLSETPAESFVERALIIAHYISQHMKLARLLGAPAGLVR